MEGVMGGDIEVGRLPTADDYDPDVDGALDSLSLATDPIEDLIDGTHSCPQPLDKQLDALNDVLNRVLDARESLERVRE
jgi:hypothetical protein